MANGTRFEVIVADNASTDATQQMGRQLPWLRIWRSEHNQGFLNTCNGAAALARGELLLHALHGARSQACGGLRVISCGFLEAP
jgi:glycosyltransferase involved in cell wall biosynthesis